MTEAGAVMTWLPSAALAVLIAAAAWMLGGVLVNMGCHLGRGRIRQCPPGARARLLLTLGGLPALMAALTVILVAVPGAGHGLVADHCHASVGCGAHGPAAALGHTGGLAALLLAGMSVLLLAGRLLRRAVRYHRNKALLHALSRPCDRASGLGCRVVDSERPVAMTFGLIAPRVYLSTGLLAALTPDKVQAILAHEHAHRARRDTLRLSLVAALTPPAILWRYPMDDLRAAIESCADQRATGSAASRTRQAPGPTAPDLAEALLSTHRLRAGPTGDALSVDALEQRLASLLCPRPDHTLHRVLPLAFVAAVVVILAAGTAPVHVAIEQLLAWLG